MRAVVEARGQSRVCSRNPARQTCAASPISAPWRGQRGADAKRRPVRCLNQSQESRLDGRR